MEKFSLDLEAPINGIYLSSQVIDLLSIIQCKTLGEIKSFVAGCAQIQVSEKEQSTWNENNLESIKRELVEKYKSTLTTLEQNITDNDNVYRKTLEELGIPSDEIDSYLETLQKEGYEGIRKKLKEEHPEKYESIIERANRHKAAEEDQVTLVTYEELQNLNESLSQHDTILVAAGRYYNVVNKLHESETDKYDFYHAKRGLDFCYENGKFARYHTLLDKQTMEEIFPNKRKPEILKELEEYVKHSIDFISKYNEEHKINGQGVIKSVDLFNEIISFDPPYKNMWQEMYGISNEELLNVFQYALEHKPEGVTYVYNEPFLENSERREAVLEELAQIHKIAPGLIDTIGTQMHIELNQDNESIRQCFEDLKRLKEELGIGTQITEFDICMPERALFDENGKVRNEAEIVEIINEKLSQNGIRVSSIAEFKKLKIKEISETIKETGIELDGVSYWSTTDTLDHNVARTNRNTYEQGLQREIVTTRYAGLYSSPERKKSIQNLVKEAIDGVPDLGILDEIEKMQATEQKQIEENKDIGEQKD